jgi:hypothetical protein
MYSKTLGLFLAITLSCCATSLLAQSELSDWQSAAEWANGTIITNEDEELSGKLRYDDLQSILFYRDGTTEKTFSSRQVKMFRFTDSVKRADRLFFALEFEDRKSNIKRPLFFELIREFKTFAVLSKVDPVEFNELPGKPRGSRNAARESGGVMRIQQFETICFMSPGGLIEPYLELEITIKNGVFAERVRNKETVLNDELFEKYFGASANAKIMTFVKHNALQLNSKEDLLKILEYYEKYLAN